MSVNPDTPSTTNRDWIFPSQPFNPPRTPARRFSSPYPRTTLFQNSLSPPPPPSNSTSPLRRRISHRHRIVKQESSVRDEIHDKSNDVAVLSEDCPNPGNKTTSVDKKFARLFRRFTVSRQAACIIAVLVTCFTSLVHKNFSLHNQVSDLQGELSKLDIRLRHCNISDSIDISESMSEQNISGASLKTTALILSLVILSLPLVFITYMEYISCVRRPSDC
ncbi:probable ion channel CASTOR, partial [Capsicum annuum]|uniref:probable ion channel CASTOR n=1 Tax=Capsicum annuum TaxID=4072 RepID=UPI001FB1215D